MDSHIQRPPEVASKKILLAEKKRGGQCLRNKPTAITGLFVEENSLVNILS